MMQRPYSIDFMRVKMDFPYLSDGHCVLLPILFLYQMPVLSGVKVDVLQRKANLGEGPLHALISCAKRVASRWQTQRV
jgi:hypothetical protein